MLISTNIDKRVFCWSLLHKFSGLINLNAHVDPPLRFKVVVKECLTAQVVILPTEENLIGLFSTLAHTLYKVLPITNVDKQLFCWSLPQVFSGFIKRNFADIVKVAGLVLVRQRPGTAEDICFITIEDETGVANLVVFRNLFESKYRKEIISSRLLMA